MKNLKKEKFFKIEKNQLEKIKCDFIAESLSEKETEKTIHEFYNKFKYILDPHTAVAFGVLNKISCEGINVVLATAHPSKFSNVVMKETQVNPQLPEKLQNILIENEKFDKLPKDIKIIQNYILERV